MPEFKRKPIEGVFPLMPLCLKDNQEIDYDGIAWNINWLEEKGIHGFITFGCMGQMQAVSEQEFDKVCDVCVDASRGKKIACVVSSTAANTKEVLRRAKYAEDAGADGSMVTLPYAFPVIAEWAVEFYRTVDESLKGEMAIMLYNIPPTNRFNVTATLWREHLLKIKSIKAIKDSNFEIAHHDEVLITIADKVNWFSCADSFFWHDAMLGAKGIIGLLAWAAPRAMLKYYEDCRKGHQIDPWTLSFYKATVNAFGVVLNTPSAPMASYEHGYLNALAEIGGAKAGTPRKPYERLPKEARLALEKAVRPLLDMEKKLQ
ncbi:dihydrodipicolinate synthase family protein [Chloroflexota bacterium]